jgi:hypothetical protein
VEVHPAPGDVAHEITHKLHAHWLAEPCEVKQAGHKTGHFIGEMAAEERRFETKDH